LGKGPEGALEQNSNLFLATVHDPEEITGSSNNTEQSHLQRVTYGRNNALHVVAGVMETMPKISFKRRLFLLILTLYLLVIYTTEISAWKLKPLTGVLLLGIYIYEIFLPLLPQDPAENKFLAAASLTILSFFIFKKIGFIGLLLGIMIYLKPIISFLFRLIPNETFQDSIFKFHDWYAQVTTRILYKRKTYLDIAKVLLQHNPETPLQ
jgi:hypothetical protein